jgi:hypothetical protein
VVEHEQLPAARHVRDHTQTRQESGRTCRYHAPVRNSHTDAMLIAR